jgi:translation initiation factor 1
MLVYNELVELLKAKEQNERPSVSLKLTMPDKKSKLVYSTDKFISRKERPAGNNRRGERPFAPTAHQKVIVRLDRKRRGGKSVTVIEGLQIPIKDMETLLKELKAGLGTGGTVKDTTLEIQGDHCDALIAALTKLGYRPKHSGG